ncbi:MAG TPA: PIN domain-containing protein [Thermoanaerobaculia bacterium]|nr:PIN domain-containing protein [Thermoanaerobaculia bacterium]
MLLVDTSVWIEVFRKPKRLELESVVDLDEIVTCLPVIQEVLQGFLDERAFRVARESMFSFPIVESPLTIEVFEEAAQLFRSARRSGVTVRSGVDCLIAACAIRHGLPVLHCDRDFSLLAQVSQLQARKIELPSPGDFAG